ncbi:hypothetical protein [Roseateles sp. YR242]|uniref:hypothetical protein n=1 Tax=Roseateles sp. YR242 TaxID=1855305 RepID=UPI001C433BC5|nr:hypothetical protein [Roseateles sp. YR242]
MASQLVGDDMMRWNSDPKANNSFKYNREEMRGDADSGEDQYLPKPIKVEI